MDDAKLNGRTVWEQRGEDPYEDLIAPSDAVAKSAHIRKHDGRLVLFDAGARRILNREILAEHICPKNVPCRDGRGGGSPQNGALC